jgi:uncharacterized protein with LGFP repeats
MPATPRVPTRALAVTLLLPLVLAALLASVLVVVSPARPASAVTTGQAVVDRAAREYGKPYGWGATGPGSFDCSGFTGYVFRSFGITLPRTSREQYAAVPHVPTGQEQPGDLIFTYNSGGVYHVGIYAGGGMQWAATKAGDIVRPQSMFSRNYYVGRPAGLSSSAIAAHWSALGGAASVLGQPITGEIPTPARAGSYTHYQAGSIYASPWTPAREVHGEIRREWSRLGWEESVLGFPVTDELAVGDARFNHFQGGSIYWSVATGPQEVHGSIRQLWADMGWERSVLGLPVTGELPATGSRYNHFQGGSIYWSPATGAQEVHGSIRQLWSGMGWENSVLGLPTTSELPALGGRYNRFQGGSIYWSPATGAHEVHGTIGALYVALGAERSALGYPVSDESDAPGGARVSRFQHGAIRWTPAGGAVVTPA